MEQRRIRISELPLFEELSPQDAQSAASLFLEEVLKGMSREDRSRMAGVQGEVAHIASLLVRRDVVGFNIVYDHAGNRHVAVFSDQDMKVLPAHNCVAISSGAAELFYRVLALELHRQPGVGESATYIVQRRIPIQGVPRNAQVRWTIMAMNTPSGNGYVISMRKQTLRQIFSLDDLRANGTLDERAWRILRGILEQEQIPSIFVLGAPAAGKTTMLNALLLELYRGLLKGRVLVAVGESSDFAAPPVVRAPDGRPSPSAILQIFPPGSAELGAISDTMRRFNAVCCVIGEITAETVPLVLQAMQTFAAVFGTMHARSEGFVSALWRESGMRGDVQSVGAILRPCYLLDMDVFVRDGRDRRRLTRISLLRDGELEVIYESPGPAASVAPRSPQRPTSERAAVGGGAGGQKTGAGGRI